MINIHEASNICSKAAQEKLTLLEELLPHMEELSPHLSVDEIPRVQKTIKELKEAIETLNFNYPFPLGINVDESINLRDRFGG